MEIELDSMFFDMEEHFIVVHYTLISYYVR